MTAAFVQLAPDSTGKKVQTFENTLGADTVEAQAVVVVGADGVPATFFQATQPVSLAAVPTHAVTQSGAWSVSVSGTVPVSGTFFQATQPVSIAATVAVSGPLTDTQLRASAVKAREDTAAMTWVSVKSAAPLASAVQADTGALAAGDYDFDIYLCASDTVAVGKGLVVEHRNAANGATTQTLHAIPAGVSDNIRIRRYTLALNERIRVIAGTAAGAASSMYVSAIGRRVS